MEGNFKRNLLVFFSISLIILIVSSTFSFRSISSLLKSNGMVNHTQEVIFNLNEGGGILIDAQTSMRGFLITGNKSFLEQYNDAEERADSFFGELRILTADNPKQQRALDKVKVLRERFFDYLDKRVKQKLAGVPVVASDLDEGKDIMDQLRAYLKQMETEEQALLIERNGQSEQHGLFTSVLIVIAALISLAISVLFFIRIVRDYNERQQLHKELKNKDSETAERIRVISNIAGEIAKGNYEIRVTDTESDTIGSVGYSLNNMADSLKASFNSLADNEWLQAGIAELNQVMIGEKTPHQLASDVVEYIAHYTESNAALLYLLDGDDLFFTAGYSFSHGKVGERLTLGEGLTGQAAASSRILEMHAPSHENISISYALGEAKPNHILAVPVADDRMVGVIELATVGTYTDLDKKFLTEASDNIAIAIKSAQSRQRIQELLEETQAQSEELQVQHSELENMNAELEAQTSKLQASEEELRVQQEELQQTNEELAERSVLLEERNMEIQKKSEDLELSTRYKSEFLANMSHELRTPLNSILLLSRLLSENNEGNMTDEQREFAKVIQSSGNGLLGLIDEILDLSKIEAGKMEMEFLDVSVKEVEDTMKNLFGEVAKEKGIMFTIDDSKAPLVIKTDKMRLEQILKNLISNAIKFTSEGSVSLIVRKDPKNEKSVQFIVKDTGIGIPREKQPLIFEAFQQADGSTKRKYGGTGLGLSISRELAKLLGGVITLQSVANEGSEFTLSIPVLGSASGYFVTSKPVHTEQEAEVQQRLETAAEEKKEADKYISETIPEDVPDDRDSITEGDKVILIVEDDTNFAKSLLEFTRQRNYKGVITVRGDRALNLAMAYNPAGILLDIELPVKSGWEVMEELKANPLTRHIPVHIMSSHKLKRESLLKGAINFLEKPAAYEQIPEVFRRIEHIVNKESQKVLIIEDNPQHAQALAYFLESYNINSEIKSEVNDGINALQQAAIDCVILDMGIPDKYSYEILDNVKKNPGLENLPVIVFTGKSLSMKEELKIKKYADSIVVKTAHSYQRMLDEVSLFLHLVEQKKNEGGGRQRKYNALNNILHEKTVLVVDDDVRNIYSLTKALELLKMNVLTAIDGEEALKVLEEHPEVSIVLLDMMMPNMDGYETATRIRKNNKLKNLPVIAVTAKAMTGDREKCINAGASDYITKPVDVDQLLSLLRVWLYDKA